ncbi:glutamate--cysteine ligase [Rickettsiales bacterium]|nr:glutamate--cysteine ligase [Rickettsiales bacterium]
MNIIARIFDAINQKGADIDAWIEEKQSALQPIFYNSIDIRYSGHKIAPVDFNFFPAGFNNIGIKSQVRAAAEIRKFLEHQYPDAKKILLISENYTRNLKYLDNIHTLAKLITEAGYEARCGAVGQSQSKILKLKNGGTIKIGSLIKEDSTIKTTRGFTPDVIIMNSDMTQGMPETLRNIKQPITPPTKLGWFQRSKSTYFAMYDLVLQDFCLMHELDPWLLSAIFHECPNVSFKEKQGIEQVADIAEKTIEQIKERYRQHQIKSEPYVFIKPNNGTYGMGIMTANSGEEIMAINKKIRNKMHKIKANITVDSVIIQEGIPTIDRIGKAPAELVSCLINNELVSCLYRANDRRDKFANLNSLSATLQKADNLTTEQIKALRLISKIAVLAAAKEMQIYLNS